jgi:hypothetical protein
VDLLDSALNFIAAAAALGTAAFGLVDGSKAFRGGISNAGYGHLRNALLRFEPALTLAGEVRLMETIRANWLNGKPLPDQKAAAKALIRLGITPENAANLADATGVSAAELTTAAEHVYSGDALTEQDMNILGRFDTLVEAILDLGYERADQMYRNSAKAVSSVVAVALALFAAWLFNMSGATAEGGADLRVGYVTAFLAGILATPLAPMAKDITSSLQAAAGALKAASGIGR